MNPGSHRSAIESALLDYHRSPGRYALIRKQPPLLFSSIKEVLQLASGRSPAGTEYAGPTPAVRQAACFFIRSALLYPDADHYALLGLESGADAAAVKDRYRLMMRLMHPDFSSSRVGAKWPDDAASRVNQAYEVLSSPVQRSKYDEQRDTPAQRPAPPEPRSSIVRVAAAKAPAEDPRRRLKQLATVFGAAGAVALVASLGAMGGADKDSLVQRAAPPRPTAARAWPVMAIDTASPVAQSLVQEQAAAPFSPPLQAPPAALPVTMQAQWQEPLAPAASSTPAIYTVNAVATPPPPPVTALRVSAETVAQAPAASPAQTVAAPSPAPRAAPNPGLTATDVHPLLANLLQQLESGWGDRVLGVLERDARSAPSAQALLSRYNELVEGRRPVSLSDVRFKSEPRDGSLIVTGHVLIRVRNQPAAEPARVLALQAEFASRNGTVVMTRLAPAQE